MKKIIALFCIILILGIPFSYAINDDDEEEFEERETGESIMVYVKEYEPKVLTASLIEQDDVPVYAYLSGSTIGSLAFPAVGRFTAVKRDNDFFVGLPPIKRVYVYSVDGGEYIKGRPVHKKPMQYSLDNLGYIVIWLKRIEKEEEVPEVITLNMTAKVEFEMERGLGLRQTLVLDENRNEEMWMESDELDESKIFGGYGYVRASEIGRSKVDFVVYDSSLREIASFSVGQDEISRTVELRDAPNLLQSQFRLRLDNIVDPTKKRAEIELIVDGEMIKKTLSERESLYGDSNWEVYSIKRVVEDGKMREEVILRKDNDERLITKTYDNILFKKSLYEIKTETKITENFIADKFDIDVGKIKVEEPIISATLKKDITFKDFLDKNNLDYETEDGSLTIYAIKGVKLEDLEKKIVEICPDKIIEADAVSELAKEKLTQEDKIKLYCSAINEFKKVVTDFPEEKDGYGYLWKAKAYYMIANAYEKLSSLDFNEQTSKENAKIYYRSAKSLNYNPGDVDERIDVLTQQKNIDYNDAYFEDDDKSVEVHLVNVFYKEDAKTTSADIEVDSTVANPFVIGDYLFKENVAYLIIDGRKGVYKTGDKIEGVEIEKISSNSIKIGRTTLKLNEEKTVAGTGGKKIKLDEIRPDWEIYDITDDEVILKRFVNEEEDIEKLGLDKDRLLEGHRIRVTDIRLNKQVQVTVLPGSGQTVFSESSFTIRIPIEKRLINLTTDMLDERIKKTEETIEKLDNVINKLTSILKGWKIVCLGTFAALTIKNSFGIFGGGAAKIEARRRVMDGVDGWRQFCLKNSGKDKLYSNYDKCVFENSGAIKSDLDNMQKALEQTKKEFKKDATMIGDKDLSEIEVYSKTSGENLLDDEQRRSYMELLNLKEACGNAERRSSQGTYLPTPCADVDEKLKVFEETVDKSVAEASYLNDNLGGYENFDEWKEKNKDGYFRDYERDKRIEIDKMKDKFELEQWVQEKYSQTESNSGKIERIKVGDDRWAYFLVDDKGAYRELREEKDQLTLDMAGKKYVFKKEESEKDSITVSGIYFDGTNYKTLDGRTLTEDNGRYFLTIEDKKIEVKTSGSLYPDVIYREDYASGAKLECTPDGKPFQVPLGKGDYAEVLSFSQTGEPEKIRIWNVGADGLLDGNDELKPCGHESELGIWGTATGLPKCRSIQSKAIGAIKRAYAYCKKCDKPYKVWSFFPVAGKSFPCSTERYAEQTTTTAYCSDVMDPEDCRILFGVCDPVMCPASRFNLGGRWKVDNVVATGLIGSIFLGLHNFELPYEPIPICLTGINAGLQNIRSILQGYVKCLKAAQVEGISIGICDKVRSVFICQTLWREAIALLNVHGSIFGAIEKMFGVEGGGEYLTFGNSLQNIEDSVSFFTKEYASTAFAAYDARSLDEIGTEICKAAIFGKIPGMGEFIDQLAEPESPPQFTAVFEEVPYAAAQHLSQYNVFYHIYAGEDKDRDYAVYLKNILGEIYGVTEECGKRRGFIEKGNFAQESMDCIAETGFNEVCVNIDGKEECGFGKVTTSFTLNYLNDIVVQNEVKKGITRAEECVPDTIGFGSTIPFTGFANSGIVRICSVENPGQGTNPKDWEKVGTCGKDSEGRFLGYCWIDKGSIDIKDESRREEIEAELTERGVEAELYEKMPTKEELVEEEKTRILNLDAATQTLKKETKTCDEYVDVIKKFMEALSSFTISIAAEAQYQIGMVYIEFAEKGGCGGYVTVIYPKEEVKEEKPAVEKAPEKKVEATCEKDGLCKTDCSKGDTDCSCKENKIGAGICEFGCASSSVELLHSRTGICCSDAAKCCQCKEGPCCDGCNFKEGDVCSEPYERYECAGDKTIKRIKVQPICDSTSFECTGVSEELISITQCGMWNFCKEGKAECQGVI